MPFAFRCLGSSTFQQLKAQLQLPAATKLMSAAGVPFADDGARLALSGVCDGDTIYVPEEPLKLTLVRKDVEPMPFACLGSRT